MSTEPVRVPVTEFDQAIALLGLPAEKDGAILTSVHVEAGTITGVYTVVNKVLYLTEEVDRAPDAPTGRLAHREGCACGCREGYGL